MVLRCLKIRNESDRETIRQMCLYEKGSLLPTWEEHFIKRRKTIIDAVSKHKDPEKRLNAKRNWKLNRHRLIKGIHQWQASTAGKTCMRKIHRFNMRNNADGYKGLYTEDFSRDDALKTLLSLQTHLIIEAQYCIPDLETHISTVLMIESALEVLDEITRKVRLQESLDQEDLSFLKDLTV